MRYIWQHIGNILDHYTGGIPLSHFLKNYFKLHPKLGSRDRKILSEMAYCYFRAARGLPAEMQMNEKVQASVFLCDTKTEQVFQFLPTAWGSRAATPEERIKTLQDAGIGFEPDALVSMTLPLSQGMDHDQWRLSMLRQPRLFIRLRSKPEQCLDLLRQHGIEFKQLDSACLSLPIGTDVEKMLPRESYVVQDASSQKTGKLFNPHKSERWWDCCAGAGGKSLLLKDNQPGVILTVSDRRASILHNLSERFRLYGHLQPESLLVDVSDADALAAAVQEHSFDAIICDAPCSGSGTWFRTPEQLYFFDEGSISDFSSLQRKITSNVIRYLKPGGKLFYITCSVFWEENEAVVASLVERDGMKLQEQKLINGMDLRADCMFAAVLEK